MIAAAVPTILQGTFGLAVLVGLAWLLSEDRRAVAPRLLLAGRAGNAARNFCELFEPTDRPEGNGERPAADALIKAAEDLFK